MNAPIILVLWALILRRRIKKYPAMRQRPLVVLSKALTCGRMKMRSFMKEWALSSLAGSLPRLVCPVPSTSRSRCLAPAAGPLPPVARLCRTLHDALQRHFHQPQTACANQAILSPNAQSCPTLAVSVRPSPRSSARITSLLLSGSCSPSWILHRGEQRDL